MGRTYSTLWFKGNGVKPNLILHISPSSCKWCRDRSGGSSIADEAKGKLVLDIMKMVLVVALVSLPLVSIGGRGAGLEMRGLFDGPGGRCNRHLNWLDMSQHILGPQRYGRWFKVPHMIS